MSGGLRTIFRATRGAVRALGSGLVAQPGSELPGDALAAAVAPVAEEIDRRLGTEVARCGGCAAAQRGVNGGGALPGERPERVI